MGFVIGMIFGGVMGVCIMAMFILSGEHSELEYGKENLDEKT